MLALAHHHAVSNTTTAPVQVVQADQHLLGQVAHYIDGDAPVVEALDEGQQVLSQHLWEARSGTP